MKIRFLIIGALLIFTAGGGPQGVPAAFADEKPAGWTLNLKDVDIRVFAEQVSTITGENFVFDPAVKGPVTVVATKPMNVAAVHELFLTVLRVNGYAALPDDNATRIVPQANAKFSNDNAQAHTSSHTMITRVIELKNADVDETVKILKPLISQNGYLEGSAASNAIIVSDYADHVSQMLKTLDDLDKEGSAEVEVIPLKEGWVGNIVPLVEAMSPVQLGEGKKGRNRLRVVADERSNSIIVRGEKKERQTIRALVTTLDQKTPNGSDIQLIRLQYRDAKDVANLLRGIVFDTGKSTSTPGGAPNNGEIRAAPTPNAAESAAVGSLFGATSATAAGHGFSAGSQDVGGGQSFIQEDRVLNALVVRAEPAVMSNIRALVRQIDQRQPQVLIEAAVIEITADQNEQLGVQLAEGKVARGIHTGTTQFADQGLPISTILTALGSANAAATSSEGLAIALGSTSNFNVIIQALANTSGANLLSTPSITTLDNEEARIVVGQNVPFRTGSFSTLSSGIANPFTTIQREDIGITLRVIPQIHEGNLVRLTIVQEVSSIANPAAQISGAADLITNKRTIETKILAENGETVVLGGLMEDDVSQSVNKVPVLGDIPLIGALFRDTSNSSSKRNLLVFLRPTVLGTRQQMAETTQARYGRIYDLQLGGKKAEQVADGTYAVPTADTVFNPPPKPLPWLLPGVQTLPWLSQ